MTINDWLRTAQDRLHEISTARLDALVLLEDCLGKDRTWILASPSSELNEQQVTKLQKLLTERAKHVPLAYLRGRSEFYGRDFVITSAVLEPRPESEAIIGLLKALPDLPSKPHIADVGAGSGALGITAALELPNATVELLEIDPEAIKIAQHNVDKYTTSISVIESDLLSAGSGCYDVLLCNLPYVPDDFAINAAAKHEPKLAIFGGQDGLDLYRKLFLQVQTAQIKPLYILTEALPSQHTALEQLAATIGYTCTNTDDFIQVFKNTSA